MASEWTDIGSISDGMLADYEVLANLMNNENWLKERAVGVSVFNDGSGGGAYNEKTSDRHVRFKAGVFTFSFSGASTSISKSFSSINRPLVFATVGNEPDVTVSVSRAATDGATFFLKKTGTGTVKGYVTWLAITTE